MDGNPKKVDAVIINDEEETPSLLNPMSGDIFLTNHVGKAVMELANGERNIDDLINEITRRFKGASKEVVSRDVAVFLKESTERGLITWNAP
jgi:hypothetical protein